MEYPLYPKLSEEGEKEAQQLIDAFKVKLSKVAGSSGLKKTLSDLIDAINLLTVPTGTGPSGTPINATTSNNS